MLRDYQHKLKNDLYASWNAGNRNVLLVCATGGGKTVTMQAITDECQGYTWSIAHRRELVGQISLAAAKMGVYHRIIAPDNVIKLIIGLHIKEFGRSFVHQNANHIVASVQTINARIDQLRPLIHQCRLWNMDESHHIQATNLWGRCVAEFINAWGAGYTALAQRGDKKALRRGTGGIFDSLVLGPEPQELIDLGYLVPFVIYGPQISSIDTTNVPVTASGDYSPVKLSQEARRSSITGDIVRDYLRFTPGKIGATFCVDVGMAEETTQAFIAAGVPAAMITDRTPDTIRFDTMADLRCGIIKQVVNVDILGEGVDVPVLEVVSLGRPTESLQTYKQQVGRVCRPAPEIGKTCVARGSLVLSLRGLIPIEKLTIDDMVWDGVNFVRHGGVICKGIKNVITYAGLTATPDHQVWTEKGWLSFRDCFLAKVPIAQTGLGRTPIRNCENLFTRNGMAKVSHVCSSRVRRMQKKIDATLYKSHRRTNKRLSCLQSTDQVSQMVLCACSKRRTTLQQPERFSLQKLRSTRNTVQISGCNYSRNLDKIQFRCFQTFKIRSNRKRRSLRTRKYSMVDYFSKQWSYQKKTLYGRNAQVPSRLSGNSICRCNTSWVFQSRNDRKRNNKTISSTVLQTKREVWDILDVGPLSRFTVQGLLVHNCGVIIDHVKNVERHGPPTKPAPHSLDAPERRARSALADPDEIPIRTCPQCWRLSEAWGPTCVHCGYTPAPVLRERPELVEGDLMLYTPELLARLAGEAVDIMKPPRLPVGAGPAAVAGRRAQAERDMEEQENLRDAIAWWAGVQRDVHGRSDIESYMRFYRAFGTDVATAQTLNAGKAKVLYDLIWKDIGNDYP